MILFNTLQSDYSLINIMLYLARKVGDSVIINNDIEIKVVSISGSSVKLGCVFPSTATVLRKELHDRIRAQNIEAIESFKAEGSTFAENDEEV